MKLTVINIISCLLLITFIICCNNSTDAEKSNAPGIASEQVAGKSSSDSITIWEFDADKDLPVSRGQEYFDSLTTQQVVAMASIENVVLDFVKQSHDTIFVRIKNSEHLTQRMGTSGARGFLSVATYTLTELNGVRYVNFDFTEGDHAVPGTYDRTKFGPHQE